MSVDIKEVARRTLIEIMPDADVAALAEVVHPDCVNHEAPPGTPQGLEGMKQTTLWLREVFSDLRGKSTRLSAKVTQWPFIAPSTDGTPAS